MPELSSPYLERLKNRINLRQIPFSDRGSRLMVFLQGNRLSLRLAERWFKREGQLSGYRQRPPLIDDWEFTDGDGQPLGFELTSYPHRLDFAAARRTYIKMGAEDKLGVYLQPNAGHGRHAGRRAGDGRLVRKVACAVTVNSRKAPDQVKQGSSAPLNPLRRGTEVVVMGAPRKRLVP